MINRLTNLRPSVLLDKWQFDTSQDWEVLGADFDGVSSETIPDATLRALGFQYSPLGYLEEGAPQFVNVTDKPELAIEEPEGNVEPIMDPEDEKARNVSERAAKKKVRRDNLRAPVRKALATDSAAPSSSCPLVPGLSSGLPMPGLSSGPPVPGSLFPPMPAPLSLPVPTPLSPLVSAPSSPLVPAPSSPPVPALLSHSMLGPALTRLTSSALRTSNEPCQISLWAIDQLAPALQSLFVRFQLKAIASGLLIRRS